MKELKCEGCDRPIAWGVGANGTKIPLDLKVIVYSIFPNQGEEGDLMVARDHNSFVSHFNTCTNSTHALKPMNFQKKEIHDRKEIK